MSDRLSLAGIREGAMNPPVGGAAGAEDFLWNQLLQAREDERQAELQGLRDASNRALHRSGWYNVGSMLMPQDAGDVALSMAMGPGLGRAGRAVMAGLGGMLSSPSDAEGAILGRQWFQRMRGMPDAAMRQEGARGLDAMSDASRELRRSGLPQDLLSLPDDAARNAAFNSMLDVTAERGVIPTDYGLAAVLTENRPRSFTQNFWEHVQDLNQSPVEDVLSRERRNLVQDPWLDTLFPGQLELRNHVNGPAGWYTPGTNRITLATDYSRPLDLVETFDHELQHLAQARTPGRQRVGANPNFIQQNQPAGLWDEYLAAASRPGESPNGWTSVPGGTDAPALVARDQMYRNNFGEWEARLAGQIGRLGEIQRQEGRSYGVDGASELLRQALGDWSLATPDFRVR